MIFSLLFVCFLVLAVAQFDCDLMRRQGICGQLNQNCQQSSASKTTVDFVLAIDGSSSMEDNIAAVRNGLINFAADIATRNIDPNWMVIQYGMYPEITLDWTKDTLLVADVLGEINAGEGNYFERRYNDAKTHPPSQSILVHDDHDCKCNNVVPINVPGAMRNFGNCGPCTCRCGTKEAPWEVVQMALCKGWPLLNAAQGGNCTFNRHPQSQTAKLQGPIVWNVGSKGEPSQKFMIILTDEDADCPFWTGNRPPGAPGNCKEPPSTFPTRLTGSANDFWVREMEETAKAVLEADLSLQMFVNRGAGPARNQFGDPSLQTQNPDFSNFDADATLARLLNSAASGSMQARLLQGVKANPNAKATYRVFDVDQVEPQNPDAALNFFRELGGAIKEECAFKKKREEESVADFSGQIVGCFEYSCTSVAGCSQRPLCSENCDQCFIENNCYQNGDVNPANPCQQCDTTQSKEAWSSCNDFNQCTDDTCTPGVGCQFTPRCVPECGFCLIDGQCWPRKEYKDANRCEWCLPEVSPTAWCGTGFCPDTPACAGDVNPQANCNNGVLDDGEENVDCGGPCLPCPGCSNGLQDVALGELGIDCGGPCPTACSCSDLGCPCAPGVIGACSTGLECSAQTFLCATPQGNGPNPACVGKEGTPGCPCTNGACTTGSCNAQQMCEVSADPCPQCGTAGHPCVSGTTCNAGLKCLTGAGGGFCIVDTGDSVDTTVPCVNGACSDPSQTCNAATQMCATTTNSGSSCDTVAGPGCPCKQGGVCDGTEAVCEAGFCSLCPAGTAGCGCIAGPPAQCSGNAVCANSVCCDPTPGSACAIAGKMGGPCKGLPGSYACDGSLACHPMSVTCVAAGNLPPPLEGCDTSLTEQCYALCAPNKGACTCKDGLISVICEKAEDEFSSAVKLALSLFAPLLILVALN